MSGVKFSAPADVSDFDIQVEVAAIQGAAAVAVAIIESKNLDSDDPKFAEVVAKIKRTLKG